MTRPPTAQVAQPPTLIDLLGPLLPAWRGADVLTWCPDPHPSDLLETAGARVRRVKTGPRGDATDIGLADLQTRADEEATLSGAIAISVLDTVHPDELLSVLQWLHDLLSPGGTLAVRVSTNLLGENTPPARFCAATFMTAFRRAGFDFKQFDRLLAPEDHPMLIRGRQKMSFHDPLELRTIALDAVLTRPDRVSVADLLLVEK